MLILCSLVPGFVWLKVHCFFPHAGCILLLGSTFDRRDELDPEDIGVFVNNFYGWYSVAKFFGYEKT